MASLISDNWHDRGKAVGYLLSDTQRGRDYTFILHGNHVEIEPEGSDWRADLTADEKLKAFRKIMTDFRDRTVGDHGYKIVALGVTTEGKLYISGNANDQHSSDPYHRSCAERSMIKISSERDAYEKKSAELRHGSNQPATEPALLDYDAIYILGADAERLPIVAPCGDCTELLGKRMRPEGEVVMLPVTDQEADLTINRTARFLHELKPGEAWQTTIRYLRQDHEIALPKPAAERQQQSLRKLATEISSMLEHQMDYPPPQRVALYNSHLQEPAEGKLLRRPPQAPKPDVINQMLLEEIKPTVLNRVRGIMARTGDTDTSPDHIYTLITTQIEAIRASILQTDTGRLYSGHASRSGMDNAGIGAEMQALGNATRELGTAGVVRIRSMELNPDAIARGVLRTTPKPDIERPLKRRSYLTGTVEFGFLPFNTGLSPTPEKAEIRMAEELFPGSFKGKHGGSRAAIGQHTYRVGLPPAVASGQQPG